MTFVRNPAWLPAWMSSDEVRALVSEAGDKVLAAAKANAAGHVVTGEFEASIEKSDGTYRTGRPYSRILSRDPAVLSIEFGTKNTAAVRALGRAIRSI